MRLDGRCNDIGTNCRGAGGIYNRTAAVWHICNRNLYSTAGIEPDNFPHNLISHQSAALAGSYKTKACRYCIIYNSIVGRPVAGIGYGDFIGNLFADILRFNHK